MRRAAQRTMAQQLLCPNPTRTIHYRLGRTCVTPGQPWRSDPSEVQAMRHANARRAQILFAGAIALLVALPACGQGSSTGTTLPDGATGSDDGSLGLDTTLPDGATGSDDGSSGLDATGTGDSPADADLDADRADSGAVHCAVDAGACAHLGPLCRRVERREGRPWALCETDRQRSDRVLTALERCDSP